MTTVETTANAALIRNRYESWLVFLLLFACMTTFAPILPRFAAAQSSPVPETQKIEALIKRVGELKDAKFVRNGSTYGPTTAVLFLRAKWEANNAEIRTALGVYRQDR